MSLTEEDPIRSIWEVIWARRPILGEIMKRKGEKSLYDYTKDFFDINKSPLLDARKDELIGVAQEILEERLGAKIAQEVAEQLRRLPLVSTSDHHGPVVSPFFVNSNILMGLHHEDVPDLKYLVAFSFATVSLNNVSYPRGLLFYGSDDNNSESLIRLSIMTDKEKMGVVYRMRAYGVEDLNRAKQVLNDRIKAKMVSLEKGKKVHAILDRYFGSEAVLASRDFCEQATRINYDLWPALFHPQKKKVPDLIYLDIETLVTRLLLEVHIPKKDSLIHRFLFDPQCQILALKLFNNIPGAFSAEKDWGTYMFWALDEKNHRSRLMLKDGKLASANEQWVFECTPEGLADALKEGKIFPSMVLCYLIVSFYYGFKCLGGFSQVSDLTQTKEAWMSFLKEIGLNEEAEAVVPVQTKELNDGLTVAYMRTTKGDFIPANAVDLMISEVAPFEHFVHLAKNLRFQEMMNPLVVEIYKVLHTEEDRNPEYVALTPERLLEMSGLKDKLEKLA